MKKIILVFAFLFTAALLPVPLLSATQEAGPASRNEQKKEQYEKTMEERFRKLGKSLDDLKARAGTMAEQARKDVDRHLADAEKKRQAAARKMEEMRTEGRKRWSAFTSELNQAMDEFERAFERAKKHFKDEK